MVPVDDNIGSKCYLRRSTVCEPFPGDGKGCEVFMGNTTKVVHLRMPIRSVSYNPT